MCCNGILVGRNPMEVLNSCTGYSASVQVQHVQGITDSWSQCLMRIFGTIDVERDAEKRSMVFVFIRK
jgi:spore maturation protein SpmB